MKKQEIGPDDVVMIDFAEQDWPIQINQLDMNTQEGSEEAVIYIMEMLAAQMRLDDMVEEKTKKT